MLGGIQTQTANSRFPFNCLYVSDEFTALNHAIFEKWSQYHQLVFFIVAFDFSSYVMITNHYFLSLPRHIKHQVKRLNSCQFLNLQQSVATPWSQTLLDFPETLVLGSRQAISLPLHALRRPCSMATRQWRK